MSVRGCVCGVDGDDDDQVRYAQARVSGLARMYTQTHTHSRPPGQNVIIIRVRLVSDIAGGAYLCVCVPVCALVFCLFYIMCVARDYKTNRYNHSRALYVSHIE